MPEKMVGLLKSSMAADENLKERAKQLRDTFKNKPLFEGVHKRYEPLRQAEDADLPDEKKELTTTVKEELHWFRDFFVKAVNEALTKEVTNRYATATFELWGKTWADLPATALLNLEGKLRHLKQVALQLPVLDGSHHWKPDDASRGSVRMDPDRWQYRTVKEPYNHVKAPATDKHPAQVEVLHRDERVGKWITTYTSGCISTSQKAQILARIDEVILTVVKAREEANLVDVKEHENEIGQHLFNRIFDLE